MILKLKKLILFIILLFRSTVLFAVPQHNTTPPKQQRRNVIPQRRNNIRNQKNNFQQKKNHPKKNPAARVIHPTSKEFGLYLGIFNYGRSIPRDPSKIFFKFYINGEVKRYRIINARNNFNAYILHNRLQEGYLYEIFFLGSTIVNLVFASSKNNFLEGIVTKILGSKIFINGKPYLYQTLQGNKIFYEPGGARVVKQRVRVGDKVNTLLQGNTIKNFFIIYNKKKFIPPVQGQPGVRTLKNYIKTAFSGLGTILYVFGGGWNAAFSSGGSPQSTTIGIPQSCIDFFQQKDASYSYEKVITQNGQKIKNPSKSYYPYSGYNEYYYGGFDCSSYLGWILYNVLNKEGGKRNMNISSTNVARTYARWGYGTFIRNNVYPPKDHFKSKFRVGNIVSVCGHVWICLGTCKDGSILFIHSSPSHSVRGCAGGGVQLSALGKSKKCHAYRLAEFYMRRYYPEWYKRYRPVLLRYERYFNTKHKNAGMMQWNFTGTGLLTDPDHYARKYPHEILRDIFRNK